MDSLDIYRNVNRDVGFHRVTGNMRERIVVLGSSGRIKAVLAASLGVRLFARHIWRDDANSHRRQPKIFPALVDLSEHFHPRLFSWEMNLRQLGTVILCVDGETRCYVLEELSETYRYRSTEDSFEGKDNDSWCSWRTSKALSIRRDSDNLSGAKYSARLLSEERAASRRESPGRRQTLLFLVLAARHRGARRSS